MARVSYAMSLLQKQSRGVKNTGEVINNSDYSQRRAAEMLKLLRVQEKHGPADARADEQKARVLYDVTVICYEIWYIAHHHNRLFSMVLNN
jgi:hypothetical protein